MTTDFALLTTQLIVLTREVGQCLMGFYKNKIDVELKIDQTPLTIADKTAHQMIVKKLKQLTPDVKILSEESDYISFKDRAKWAEYWLIDPLDGTQDFVDDSGEFCICIAYIKNHLPVFGMIYAPFTKTHYYAQKGYPAFKLKNNKEQILQTVAAGKPLKIVVGHHSDTNKQLQAHLKQQAEYQITQIGSALKFCLIAEGLYDYYPRFGPCSEWDTAAGACILQSAGGQVLDEKGAPLRYNTKSDLTSPIFFASGKC